MNMKLSKDFLHVIWCLHFGFFDKGVKSGVFPFGAGPEKMRLSLLAERELG